MTNSCLLVLVVLCACVLGAALPAPPLFPLIYDTIQVSSCLRESLYCPAGFVNQSIASHSYMNYPAGLALGIDANDVGAEAAPMFAADQTFVSSNGTHLFTRIFGFAAGGGGQLACVNTTIAGTLMPPDVLFRPGAKYGGQAEWNGVLCDVWISPPEYGGLSWYVAADAQTAQRFVGFATADGSQVGFFTFFRPRGELPFRVFVPPVGVDCRPLQSGGRDRRAADAGRILALSPWSPTMWPMVAPAL